MHHDNNARVAVEQPCRIWEKYIQILPQQHKNLVHNLRDITDTVSQLRYGLHCNKPHIAYMVL